MEHMLMGRITQERPALDAALQGLGGKRESTPRRYDAAHLQTPVRIEIIEDPIIAGHRRQL